MSYLGRSAKLSLKAQEKVSFLATAGQTVKTGLSYVPSFVELYVNGVLLTDTTDFTATNGNSITFTVALLLNDEVTVISLKTFASADHYTKSAADTLLAAKSPLASPVFTGNVGVGTSSPASSVGSCVDATGPLLVGGNINSHQTNKSVIENNSNNMKLRAYGATSGTGYMTFHTGGGGDAADSEAMRIDSSANLLVNKTSQNLATVGAQFRGDAVGLVQVTRDGGEALHLNRLTNDGNVLSVYKDTALKGSIAVTASGIGIQLGGTGAANTLDDYEEGTWTPAFTGGSSGYSSQQGKYTKIGEQVTAYFMLQMNNNQVGGSTLQVGGLPFTSNSHPSYGASSGIHCNNWSTSAKKPDNGLVAPNSTNIDLYHSQGTTGTNQAVGTDIGTGSLLGCVVYRTSS